MHDVGVAVAAKRHQHALSDGHGVSTHRQRLRDVGAAADAPGDHQLHRAAHIEIIQRIHCLAQRRQRRNAHVLDEHGLGGGGTALHTVHHDHIRTGVHRQLHVIECPRVAPTFT
jgi:hypothetical protein